MAGKIKGLALMAAVALTLGATKQANATEIQKGAVPPATAPKSVLNLTEEDFRTLENLGIHTSQREVTAEFEEVQRHPEIYGPVDERHLQRRVDRDMAATVGHDYAGRTEAQQEYLRALEERYGRSDDKSRHVQLNLLEDEDTRIHVGGKGINLRQDF